MKKRIELTLAEYDMLTVWGFHSFLKRNFQITKEEGEFYSKLEKIKRELTEKEHA